MTFGLPGDLLHKLRTDPVSAWPEIELGAQHALTQALLSQEPDLAQIDDVSRFFGPPRFPGTTSIGYRQRDPVIFQDTTESLYETFPDWVERSIRKILLKMQAKGFLPAGVELNDEYAAQVVHKVEKLLELQTPDGASLSDAIPQQMYEDVFIRMVGLLLNGKISGETANLYREFNALCHRIALSLICRMEERGMIGTQVPQIAKTIQLAVLSGYVGINLKSSASAASKLLNRNLVPLKEEWIRSIEAAREVSEADICAVADRLLAVSENSKGQFGLQALSQYQEEVISTPRPTLLVFFCDDYMESVIDLKRFEVMVGANPQLTVHFVPRSGRYGNDIAYEDVGDILQEGSFAGLHQQIEAGRFVISPHGPKSGCIDPRFLGRGLINEIDTLGAGKRVVFETKGCRNFEMLHGNLQIPWYAGFNCNRALSIRTVGVDGPPVFVRIPPGLLAYDGFTQAAIGTSPSYPSARVRFARMTTRQLYAALDSGLYRRLLRLSGDELKLNTALINLGESLDMPFCELVDFLACPQVKG